MHKYEPTVVGPGVKAFLLTEFAEDPAQRPEFEVGFSALRRRELVALARKYGIDVNPDSAKDSMIPVFEQAWNDGRFPLRQPGPQPSVEALVKAEVERRLAQAGVKTAPEPEAVEDGLGDLGWHELKSLAKDEGVKAKPGCTRDDIIRMIREHRGAKLVA